ncbi:hypothetical protein [Methylomonas sp. AM2-LC]|uniref:hypothetical protein n=1 Tax=Methylomonas sp. AM2-LC TaxID=3153301 RepID=UPI0032630C42
MRMTQNAIGILFMLLSNIAGADAEFDFEEMMKDVETQTQSVQNSIAAKDVDTATADAKKLQDEFKLVENYFTKRGNASDAVGIAKEYQEKAATLQKSLAVSDYDTANHVAQEFSQQCRGACHDSYKPL